MAHWLNKIDLTPEFEMCLSDPIKENLRKVCLKAKEELSIPFTVERFGEEEPLLIQKQREEFADRFKALAIDCETVESDYYEIEKEFDYLMEELYDFGGLSVESDLKKYKMLWINTI